VHVVVGSLTKTSSTRVVARWRKHTRLRGCGARAPDGERDDIVWGQYGLVTRGEPEEVQCFAGEVEHEAVLRGVGCEAEIAEVEGGEVGQFWTGSAWSSGDERLV
jgi:hypothetical protein